MASWGPPRRHPVKTGRIMKHEHDISIGAVHITCSLQLMGLSLSLNIHGVRYSVTCILEYLNRRVQGFANMEGTTMSWSSRKAWRIQDSEGRVHDS